MCSLVIASSESRFREQAAQLARTLALPDLGVVADPKQLVDVDLVLLFDSDGLSLQGSGKRAPGPLRVDFMAGANAHRRLYGGGKSQMIAKAVGCSKGFKPEVLDVTAGLGGDAFVLACLGCQVTMLERHPVVAALLQDGLQRALAAVESSADEALDAIIQRLHLQQQSAQEFLRTTATREWPVVYVDPMFPERDKSAAIKKEMQYFHQLVGYEDDADELLLLALKVAINRVVVKRPLRAGFLAGQVPSYQLKGKSSRYDIYSRKAF